MSLTKRYFKSDKKFLSNAAIAIMIASAGLSGCQTQTVLNGGYVADEQSLKYTGAEHLNTDNALASA